MEDVASGQRIVILAILVNIVTLVARGAGADLAIVAPVSILAAVAAILGVLRMTNGLGYSSGKQILFIILVLVPLASLVTLAILNARATKALRAAGYEVGFLGAKPKRGTA
jgi:hypothetical protein